MFSRLFGGAGKKTCSERSERNSISEQVYLESVAPAAQRAGAHGVCRQCTALSQVLLQTKDMKKRTEIIRFVFVCFGADNRTCSERREATSHVIKTSTFHGCIFYFLLSYQKGLKFLEKTAILMMLN